jgi:hypothetical protein
VGGGCRVGGWQIDGSYDIAMIVGEGQVGLAGLVNGER